MNKEEVEIFTLKKSEELSPKISNWFALMQETRERLLRIVNDLKDEEFDYSPDEGSFETIGTLLLHIAGVEWSWIFEDIDGEEIDFERFKHGFALRSEVNISQLKGKGKSFYLEKLSEVRNQVYNRLTKFNDEDLSKLVGSDNEQYTIEWILFHILEHEAMHIGQILLLKRLYNKKLIYNE